MRLFLRALSTGNTDSSASSAGSWHLTAHRPQAWLGSVADQAEIPSTYEMKSRGQALCSASEKLLLAVSKGTFYYPGWRKGNVAYAVNPPSNLFQVPALDVGTNCIKPTAELPPPGHARTLLTSNSWLHAGQCPAPSHGADGEPG